MKKKGSLGVFGLAVCSRQLPRQSSSIQLFPAGEFRARDGRPEGLSGWKLDEKSAQRLIADAATRKTPFAVDYEHQTLHAKTSGNPAPAAGWFSKLEWREDGLYAVDVEWTPRAKEMVQASEYRFISPVFGYDRKTGEVTQLLMAAITNVPAMDGMDEILEAASQQLLTPKPNPEEDTMKEILIALLTLLGLPENAEKAAATAALTALLDKAGAVPDLNTQIAALTQQVADAGNPDPAQYVPVAVVETLKTQIAALSQNITDDKVTALVAQGLEDKKLLPAQEAWALELGKKDIASLTTYLDNATPIAALAGSQSKGKKPEGDDTQLSDEELAVCNLLGQTQEEFVAAKAANA